MRDKVCCIGSTGEAALAVRCGASALGLVSAMPSGPGVITETEIARIIATMAAAGHADREGAAAEHASAIRTANG